MLGHGKTIRVLGDEKTIRVLGMGRLLVLGMRKLLEC